MISLQIDSFSSFDAWTKGINGINSLISASFRFQPIYFLSLQANVFLNSSSTQKGIILIVDMASVYLSNDTISMFCWISIKQSIIIEPQETATLLKENGTHEITSNQLSGYSIDIERNVCEDPLYYID